MNKKKDLLNKTLVLVILVLFIGVGIFPTISGDYNNEDTISLTFFTFDRAGTKKCKVELLSVVVDEISGLFEELKNKITSNPFSDETKVLKDDFVEIIDSYGLIPRGLSKDNIFSLLNPEWNRRVGNNNLFLKSGIPRSTFINDIFPMQSSISGFAFLCSIAGGGGGMLFPPIMFPRPRLATIWASYIDAVTIASNLYTGHGFIAEGPQFGMALGFWGVGLSFAYPGEPAIFGFGGYALAAYAAAEYVETYPPNRPPVISEENPEDGSFDVPNTLSELSFRISDADGDRMDYSVTTNPYIGAGSRKNVVGGTYTVPVSGLNSNTEYSWRVVVSDNEDITEKTFSFRTAVEAPYVSDPLPFDGDDWVPVNITVLSFRLEDFQGDLMDYTVETFPDIGSGSGNGVGDGVYSVGVGGLEYTRRYTWFVNVTDGEYWTRRMFGFKTQPIMVFDPFDEGWLYRKQITINHSQVAGDLKDFPVLFSVVDSDLASKAQDDGDDILFMDASGVASRLLHEIELFDGSSGEFVAWVNIPSISDEEDTELYLCYGNSGCDSQQYPNKVWDSNYVAVWHMINYPDDSHIKDSTSYNNDGYKKGVNQPEEINSKIVKGQYFDGNNYINIPYSNWYPELGSMDELTLETWVKPDSTSGDYHEIISAYRPTNMYYLSFGGWDRDEWLVKICSSNGCKSLYFGPKNPQTGIWYYVVCSMDESKIRCYLDGIFEKENDWGGTINSGNQVIRIGAENSNYGEYFVGIIDEFRISNTGRSESWINTSYKNQNDPSNFFSIGPEESAP